MLVIDKCHCFNQTFAALKRAAEASGSTSIPELQQHVTFGQNCKLCHPYVARMLETGETVFNEIITSTPTPSQ
ncbi:MAG: (2Fe-2S)-binding protein [Bacteroidota bacterium]